MRLIGRRIGVGPVAAGAAVLALPAIGEMPVAAMAASLVLAAGLVWITVVDLAEFVIPDGASLGLVVAGLAATALLHPPSTGEHALAAGLAWGFFAAASHGFRVLRGYEGLGLGDAKLAAAGGAWLGPWALPSVVLIASLTALVVVLAVLAINRSRPERPPPSGIAFGPFLAFSIWLTWLYGVLI